MSQEKILMEIYLGRKGIDENDLDRIVPELWAKLTAQDLNKVGFWYGVRLCMPALAPIGERMEEGSFAGYMEEGSFAGYMPFALGSKNAAGNAFHNFLNVVSVFTKGMERDLDAEGMRSWAIAPSSFLRTEFVKFVFPNDDATLGFDIDEDEDARNEILYQRGPEIQKMEFFKAFKAGFDEGAAKAKALETEVAYIAAYLAKAMKWAHSASHKMRELDKMPHVGKLDTAINQRLIDVGEILSDPPIWDEDDRHPNPPVHPLNMIEDIDQFIWDKMTLVRFLDSFLKHSGRPVEERDKPRNFAGDQGRGLPFPDTPDE